MELLLVTRWIGLLQKCSFYHMAIWPRPEQVCGFAALTDCFSHQNTCWHFNIGRCGKIATNNPEFLLRAGKERGGGGFPNTPVQRKHCAKIPIFVCFWISIRYWVLLLNVNVINCIFNPFLIWWYIYATAFHFSINLKKNTNFCYTDKIHFSVGW